MTLTAILPALLDPPPAQTPKKPAPRNVRQVSAHAPSPPPVQAPAKPLQKVPASAAGEEREPRKQSQRNEAGSAAGDMGCWLPGGITGFYGDGGGQGDGSGNESSGNGETGQSAINAGDYDADTIVDLLPTEGDSGIFEVLFPGGETMGVMVDVRAATASFMVSAGSDKLRNLLCKKQMELEERLARRMDKYVRLTVL